MILALTMLSAAAIAAAPAPDKTMSVDDWHAFTIQSVSPVSPDGATYLQVVAGDVNGDGTADLAVIKLACSSGASPIALWRTISPRDVATGQASGKRQHKPWMRTSDWGSAGVPWTDLKGSYALKNAAGTRISFPVSDGWSMINLSNAPEMCAVTHAEITVTK